MIKSTLTEAQEAMITRERRWLSDLQVVLNNLGATSDEQMVLKNSIQQLDDLFLLVVVGEFNAGKSAFINTLLGEKMLKEGVTPTTAEINVLKYSETTIHEAEDAHIRILHYPAEVLRYLNIVDTPGTNAVIREHQEITEEFVPRSDLVLFLTSADRPFTESERTFMSQIRAWGKKVVIVINKIDLFETEADKQQVIDFVRQNVATLLDGAMPELFPISAKLALRAKQGQPDLWEVSGFAPLEAYIQKTLDETERLRLKLLNPMGVGDRFIRQYGEVTTNRLTLLKDDLDTLDNLERQFKLYEKDMRRDFEFRLADVENVLFDMEKRGHVYFDETLRLGRFFDLIRKEYIQRGFEQQVVSNVPQLIDQKVDEMIDWLVNADLNQWQSVMDYLKQRRHQYQQKLVGEVGSNFRYDRERLIDSVGRSVQRVVESYDKTAESQKIAETAQMAVAGTAAAQIGAIGLGGVLVAMTTTMAMDFTGILAASMIAAMGLFVIPNRREAAKRDLNDRMAELRVHLSNTLKAQFEKELQRSIQRISDAIAPYTRFVRAEKDKLETMQNDLQEARKMQARLKTDIENM